MDVNEAIQKLRVTDDEIRAVQNYFGFAHTSINLLSELEPERFCKLSHSGWLLAENEQDLRNMIKIFVDMYSLMYKESEGSKGISRLVRGTNIGDARRLTGINNQFLSTSMDEQISKRFSEYGSAALVRISIGEGVPHLYSENYRTEGVDEEEVIIAPFCKIRDNQFTSSWNGYEYYSVSIERGELQEKSVEEIERLTTQVLEGYEQNIADMQEYVRLLENREYLTQRLDRTTDTEERRYISGKQTEVEERLHSLWERTTEYKNNLNALLQGMCREKEKEIDQAREIVSKDREEKRKERERQKKEEERENAITELSQKIDGAFGNTTNISSSIVSTYQQLIDKEKTYRQFASELGVGLASTVEASLQKSIADVTRVVEEYGKRLKQVQIPKDSTIEEAQAQAKQYEPQIHRINASKGISDALPEVVELFEVQTEDTIKRDIYLRMHSLIKNARINLLQQQKLAVENQKLGWFDMITGKTKVQDLQLKNIALKMQLLSETVPEEKSYYSVRDMLAEIYTFSQTELGGQYTPELGRMFNAMQAKFKYEGGQRFSLEKIQKLAEPRIAEYREKNLPEIPQKRFWLFGRNKKQMERLEHQNSQLQTEINNACARKLISRLKPPTKSAISVFQERLQDISDNFGEEGPTRTQEITREETVDLWK